MVSSEAKEEQILWRSPWFQLSHEFALQSLFLQEYSVGLRDPSIEMFKGLYKIFVNKDKDQIANMIKFS